jgi:hypothetical protein
VDLYAGECAPLLRIPFAAPPWDFNIRYGQGQIEKQAEKCALEVGLDWPSLYDCATGARGAKLYHDSVFYTSDQGKAVAYDVGAIVF